MAIIRSPCAFSGSGDQIFPIGRPKISGGTSYVSDVTRSSIIQLPAMRFRAPSKAEDMEETPENGVLNC
jgi:hypothetical protein